MQHKKYKASELFLPGNNSEKKKPLYVVWFFVNSQALMHDMSYGSSKFIKSCSKMAMRNMIPDPTTRPHSCRIKWKNGFSPFFVPRAVNSGS